MTRDFGAFDSSVQNISFEDLQDLNGVSPSMDGSLLVNESILSKCVVYRLNHENFLPSACKIRDHFDVSHYDVIVDVFISQWIFVQFEWIEQTATEKENGEARVFH